MEAEEHYIEVGKRPSWSIKKILGFLTVVLIVFAAGVAVGREGSLFGSRSISSSGLSQLDYSSVEQVYDTLKKHYDGNLDQQKLVDGLKSGLVSATGDPYSEYFTAAEAKEFNNELAGSITGIGAELGTNDDNDIVIVSPLSGYPAEKAGLKPKDIIAAIDEKSTKGMTVSTAVKKIRGTPGTKVTLTVVRDNIRPFEVTITREKITVPSVKSEQIGNVGYIKINQFTTETVALAQTAAKDFKTKDLKAIILDLRGNPGGYLNAAVGISSLWLDKGQTVVEQKRGSNVIGVERATGGNILKGLPTVVLIDGGSASASEITAGALRDSGAAQLVGEKSFGKGSVQQVENFKDGSELKVTVARWYTPKGKNIDKQGITPDVTVSISEQAAASAKDTQKDKALQLAASLIR